MTDDLKLLPPAEQRVAAKVLTEAGLSSRTVEQWLDISDTTVLRASQEPTPEELKQFEAELRAGVDRMKKKGIVMVYSRILELIPKEKRISEVVKAGEYLEGKGGSSSVELKDGNRSITFKVSRGE